MKQYFVIIMIMLFALPIQAHWFKCEESGCKAPGNCGLGTHDPTSILYYPDLYKMSVKVNNLVKEMEWMKNSVKDEDEHLEIQNEFIDNMKEELRKALNGLFEQTSKTKSKRSSK